MNSLNYSYRRYCKRVLKMNKKDIKTFVFLDIETTGLPRMENNKTKITELCMVAVEAAHIQMGVFPRVQNKLNFCFNPWKLISSESEKMTGIVTEITSQLVSLQRNKKKYVCDIFIDINWSYGLSNSILEHQSKFSSDTVNAINCFLNHNAKPLCFVAHNGNNFDYPIIQREVEKSGSSLTEDIVCIDSLHMFRQLHSKVRDEAKINVTEISNCLSIEVTDETDDGANILPQKILEAKMLNETTPKKQMVEIFPSIPNPAKRIKLAPSKTNVNFDVSFKLSDIYTRMTKRSPIKEHQAEGDVSMLITCAATLGEKFVDWANTNAKNFCDIPAMVPGKKLGT